MDPATAVGLACSILNLIDFAYNIVSGAYRISKHGSTTEYDSVESVVEDLYALTLGLQDHELKGIFPHEIALKELASKCEALSEDLLTLLQTLKATKGSQWDAVMVSLRLMRKRGEITKKMSMLAEYRSQVTVQLLALLNERHTLIRAQIEREFKEKHSDLVQRLSDLQILVNNLLDNRAKLEVGFAVTEVEKLPSEKLQDILVVLSTLIEVSQPTSPEIRILRQLYFKSMYDREESVRDAGFGTYQWILEENADGELEEDDTFIRRSLNTGLVGEAIQIRQLQSQTRAIFLQWLSNENHIFHISGKAGSGKSTLMKFLSYHHQTQEGLDTWSGDRRLIFARFFAWSSGTDGLNDSIYGLCRSILFTVLKQCPELIPDVFPDAYHTFLTTLSEPFIDETPFRYSKVLEGLQRLTTKSGNHGYRFCFFIDGLDEFKNDFVSHHTHKLLADILTSWARNDHVKLLISSRPTDEFMSAFSDDLRIKLHELTKFDIMRMGRNEFEKNEEFARIQDSYVTLVNKVTDEAQGVFLWAHLTITKLLQAIKHIQDVGKLRKLIDDTPKDIDTLYQSLLDSIDSSYRDKVLKILWIVGQGIRCQILWITWVDELFTPGLDFPTQYETQAYSDADLENRLREARFLIMQAKGLLEFEIRDSPKGSQSLYSYIAFSHRTVREFVMRSKQMRMFSENFQESDGPKLEIKAMLAELWFSRHMHPQVLTQGLGMKLQFRYSWKNGYGDSAALLGAFEKLIQVYVTNGVDLPKQTITSCIFNRGRSATLGTECSYSHWVAGCVGDWKFLQHKLQENPELIHASGGLSLLLSAAMSQVDSPVFYRLLEMGTSPNETIRLTHPNGNGEASVWIVFCAVVAAAIVEAVVYSRHLGDSSWRDILSYSSHRDFYEIFRKRLEMLLKMGEVNPDVFIIIGRKGIREKPGMEEGGTHIISLKDLIKQFDQDNAESWEELFSPGQAVIENSQDIWSYLTTWELYGALHGCWSYAMKTWPVDNLTAVWNHMVTHEPQVAGHDQLPQQRYLPFRLGMKAYSSTLGWAHSDNDDHVFYVHSVMIGDTTISVWDMEVRMF
ncbi:hypothetical protein F4805DRAFT_430862 [Annulohypoxylon moriforme]|nr:hypothetical protein F4805DRAFT_430862 [Annulohypoxylon moriforme]